MKPTTILLSLTVLFVFLVQAAAVKRPPFDHHNFRQSQTAATIEDFEQHGIDLLHPRTNYVGEPGVFVLEFPLPQALAALASPVVGSGLVAMRWLSLLGTLGSAMAVWVVVRQMGSAVQAAVTVILFLSSPLNLFYMASALIDPLAVCFALWAVWTGSKLLTGSRTSLALWIGFALLCSLAGLIKPLYLFPLAVLYLGCLARGPRLTARNAGVGVILIGVLALIVAWNLHAIRTNNASPFTANIRPTSLLGVSQLGEVGFYRRILHRLLLDTLGPIGGMLTVAGWALPVFLRKRFDQSQAFSFLSVFGYWFAFANIIFPHDYYSLITVPFCAGVAGGACVQIGEAIETRFKFAVRAESFVIPAVIGSVAYFYTQGALKPHDSPVRLARAIAGHVQRNSYGMLFVSPENSPGGAPIHESPAMLYAAGLRGTGLVVADSRQAVEQWQVLGPSYSNLRYVVLYGLAVPPEFSAKYGEPAISDLGNQLTIFDLKASQRP